MTPEEIIEMAKESGFGEYVVSQDPRFVCFAKLVADKYEDEIEDLKDMIMELMERQE